MQGASIAEAPLSARRVDPAQAPIIGRLAPTPSAPLHIGNIFSFLTAWLSAKSAGGKVLLRIEDLDSDRTKPAYADTIRRELELLGLTWDNADVLYQSGRTQAYKEALTHLEAQGLVYPCFCSRADLHAATAPHRGEKPVYPGTCAHLTPAQIEQRWQQRAPALRLRVDNAIVSFEDELQGRVEQDLRTECGDFIIRRSDGVFAYQLAVVVDDLFQDVNEVVRGRDLLDSTPQQIYLRHLLAGDSCACRFIHIPLLVNEQGRRLAKRDGSIGLDALLTEFGDARHLLGYLAGLTGLAASGEPTTPQELLDGFSLERIKGTNDVVWRLPR